MAADDIEEQRNKLVIEGTRIGIWDWNVQTGETYFNERWAEIIGYSLDELQPLSIETWVKFAHPDDLEESNRLLEQHFQGDSEYYDFQSRMKHKNGEWVWVHDRGKVFEWDAEGKPLRMCGSHLDITEIKRLEMSLKKTLREKEVLLNEVHHRVKNNLQFIMSFVGLRADEDQKISTADLQNSLRAIASAHEAVYKSDDFQRINLKDYVSRVISPMSSNLRSQITTSVESVELAIDLLIPIGMIINECIANSLKHAFGDSPRAENLINVSAAMKGEQLLIEVTDNGKGLSNHPDPAKGGGIGMSIITGLASQIDADLQIDGKEGMRTLLQVNLKGND